MSSLSDLEYRVLDELYFLSSFQTLKENLKEEESEFRRALKSLLEQELVVQIKSTSGREEKLDVPDFNTLEESYFVASKKGLLIHNTRN